MLEPSSDCHAESRLRPVLHVRRISDMRISDQWMGRCFRAAHRFKCYEPLTSMSVICLDLEIHVQLEPFCTTNELRR